MQGFSDRCAMNSLADTPGLVIRRNTQNNCVRIVRQICPRQADTFSVPNLTIVWNTPIESERVHLFIMNPRAVLEIPVR
jgi:hypothetical protein